MTFYDCFAALLGIEGGYVNNPADSGGATKFGITERVARAHGYLGDMHDLSEQDAKQIAKAQYWDTLNLDAVAAIFPHVASEMFDTGYNAGIGVAGQFLQRVLNVLNHNGQDYADLPPDGIIGPMTLAAMRGYLAKRGRQGETALLRGMNTLQGARYIGLAEQRQKDEAFIYGWLMNRVEL